MNNYARIDEVPSFLSQELAAFMHRVDIEAGCGWSQQKIAFANIPMAIPKGVNTRCGHCNHLQTLQLHVNAAFSREANAITFKADCINPGCEETSTVLLVDSVSWNDYCSGTLPKEFWVLPAPSERLPSVDSSLITGDESQRIKRFYSIALDNFNRGDFSSSLAASGKVLEGIGKTQFPNSRSTRLIRVLFEKLEAHVDSNQNSDDIYDLLNPLFCLGKALGHARNLGCHLDIDAEPTEALTKRALDLAEFLLTYVYVLPGEIASMDAMIAACSISDADESESSDGATT